MFSHDYIKRDFDVDEWARPEFLEKAAEEVLKEEWARGAGASCPTAAGSRSKACGWDSAAERRAVHGSPSSDRAPSVVPTGSRVATMMTRFGSNDDWRANVREQ